MVCEPLIHAHPLWPHSTLMFVTFDIAVPAPFSTEHCCAGAEGCVKTVTLYVPPFKMVVTNEKLPLAGTDKLSVPLFCSTIPPLLPLARFTTAPEILYVGVVVLLLF